MHEGPEAAIFNPRAHMPGDAHTITDRMDSDDSDRNLSSVEVQRQLQAKVRYI